jgi:hypothetical protein
MYFSGAIAGTPFKYFMVLFIPKNPSFSLPVIHRMTSTKGGLPIPSSAELLPCRSSDLQKKADLW